MTVRWVRRGAVLFFLLFVVAVTWPGMTAFNRVQPLILGLPFSMAWIALWVVLSFLMLLLVNLAEGGTGVQPVGCPGDPAPEDGAPRQAAEDGGAGGGAEA